MERSRAKRLLSYAGDTVLYLRLRQARVWCGRLIGDRRV